MKVCTACNSRFEDAVAFCTRDGSPTIVDAQAGGAPSMDGQVIGERYKILKKLGEGGMGEVYLAEHIHIEKRVALKLLRAEVLQNAEAVQRFRQEARSASSIGHENIIAIDDFGKLPDGRIYLSMEFLEGAPLNDILTKQLVPLPRALEILIQTCRGLAAAHAKGIVHRDMKPENIYVTMKDNRDLVKILDFGIAKVTGNESNQNLTRTGTIFGTPFYMAPEQALGQHMDHHADIYSMGVICYEVFCGRVPFRGETFMGILTQHITAQPEPPSKVAAENGRAMTPELEAVILKALAKEVPQRYQSINELGLALAEIFRALVGSGQTHGFDALPRGASAFMSAQTGQNPAIFTPTGGVPAYVGGPGSGAVQASGPISAPVYAAIPIASQTGSSAAISSPVVTTPPGSKKTGLVLGLVAGGLLLGAGAVWFFVAGPGSKPKTSDAAVTGQGPDGGVPAKIVAGSTQATAPLATGGAPDAGVARSTPSVALGSNHLQTLPPPPHNPVASSMPVVVITPGAKTTQVLVSSVPPGADIYVDGAKVDKTPSNVTVTEGKPLSVTLKLDNYQDSTFTIDGKDSKTIKTLARRKRPPSEIKGWDETGADPNGNAASSAPKAAPASSNPDGLE